MKKSRITKFISFLLSIMMIVGMIPSMAFAGDLSLQNDALADEYNVKYTLQNIKAADAPTTVTTGSAINATLTADFGYELPDSIAVTVSGSAITANIDYTYSQATGKVNIPAENVIGDVEIIASAVKAFPTATITIVGRDNLIAQETISIKATEVFDISNYSDSVADGYTALHAIIKTLSDSGIDANDQNKFSCSGGYIAKINDLIAGTPNYMSGWMYAVNDKLAPVGTAQYTLNDGDNVVLFWSEGLENQQYAKFENSYIEVNAGETFKLKVLSTPLNIEDLTKDPVFTAVTYSQLYVNGKEYYNSTMTGGVNTYLQHPGEYTITAKVNYKSMKGRIENYLTLPVCRVVVKGNDLPSVGGLSELSLTPATSDTNLVGEKQTLKLQDEHGNKINEFYINVPSEATGLVVDEVFDSIAIANQSDLYGYYLMSSTSNAMDGRPFVKQLNSTYQTKNVNLTSTLTVGENLIILYVRAKDYSKYADTVYYLHVNRAKSSDTSIKGISVKSNSYVYELQESESKAVSNKREALIYSVAENGAETSGIDKTANKYCAYVQYFTDSINISSTPNDKYATYEILNEAGEKIDSTKIKLSEGENKFKISVTAGDEVTNKIYDLSVIREPKVCIEALEVQNGRLWTAGLIQGHNKAEIFLDSETATEYSFTVSATEGADLYVDGLEDANKVGSNGVVNRSFDAAKQSDSFKIYAVKTVDGRKQTYTMQINVYRKDNKNPSQMIEYRPSPSQHMGTLVYESKGDAWLSAFGGYVVYRYDTPIKNDPNNLYGIDFIVEGNPQTNNVLSFSEPANVYVAQDKDNDGNPDEWYALAGSEHYEDTTDWNYTINYTDEGNRKVKWTDSQGDSGYVCSLSSGSEFPEAEVIKYNSIYRPELEQGKLSFTGILLGKGAKDGMFCPMTIFGYGDCYPYRGQSDAVNPYRDPGIADIDTSLSKDKYEEILANKYVLDSNGDGMDISWAVDKDGNPVVLDEITFVKLESAINIDAGIFSEKSPEISSIIRVTPKDEAVGKTVNPDSIKVNGKEIEIKDNESAVDVYVGKDATTTTVSVVADGKNVIINNRRVNERTFDSIPKDGRKVRIITQDGDKEPRIIVLNLLGQQKAESNTIEKDKINEVISKTTDYITEKVDNPSVGSSGGEWAILGLSRSGYINPYYYNKYYNNVIEKLKSCEGVLSSTKYTEYSRVTIGISAIGKDAANVGGYNLLQPLSDYDKVVKQGINGAIYALLALDTKQYNVPDAIDKTQTTRDNLVKYILDHEVATGGWALSGQSADPDITAMALQSLAPYKSQTNVQEAINRALTQLSNIQQEDGGYKSWGSATSESVSQVITALSVLGIDCQTDSRFIKNDISMLKNLFDNYYIDNGSFKHTAKGTANQMATEQAYYALVSYMRFLDGKTSLYNMSDMTKDLTLTDLQSTKIVLSNKIAECKKLSELKYTEASWKKLQAAIIEAEKINNNTEAELKQVEDAISALNTAVSQLVLKGNDKNVSLRIEGISANIINEKFIAEDNVVTAIDLLKAVLDEKKISYTISNSSWGGDYVSSINGETEGYFGDDYDGWQYAVNGISPSVGAGQYQLKDNDEVVFYYGGMSIQYPIVKYTQNDDGTVTVSCTANGYDESFNPVVKPIVGVKVSWYYGDTNQAKVEYITDDKGNVVVESIYAGNGSHKLQIEKYAQTEKNGKYQPLVVRLAEDYAIEIVNQQGGTTTDNKVYISVIDPTGMVYLLKTGYTPDARETAYSLLLKTGLDVTSSTSDKYAGYYVEGIEGLFEFDKGPLSGWMYRVNGKFPGHSSSLERVSAGDYVEWLYTTDLGKDIGGYIAGIEGSSGSTSQTTPTVEVSGDSAKVEAKQNVNATVNSEGKAVAIIDENELLKSINSVVEAAKTTDKDIKKVVTIEINSIITSNPVSSVNINIPLGALKEAHKQGINEINISTGLAKVKLSDNAIDSIINQSNSSNIAVEVKKVDTDKLSETAKAIVGTRPVLDINITSGDKKITGFNDNNIELTIPYAIGENEDADKIVVYYINDEGTLEVVRDCKYDPVTKTVSFTTNHLSKYAVGYEQFSDIQNHWAEEAINYVFAKGLFNGTDNDTFSPDKSMTRAMFVTVLGRLAGADTTNTITNFNDVNKNQYYAPYIKWAVDNKIVSGKSKDCFEPDSQITREEMAVIIANYVKYIGLTYGDDDGSFSDENDISSWAKESVKIVKSLKLIQGKGSNGFDGKATATRAEVSIIFQRLANLK